MPPFQPSADSDSIIEAIVEVVEAVLLLHERGLLPGFLDALAPTAKRLSEPVVPKDHAGKFVRYSELSSLTDERERLVQHELVEWARRFRLTENLSTHGACLPWALRFGRGFCEGSPRGAKRQSVHRGVRTAQGHGGTLCGGNCGEQHLP